MKELSADILRIIDASIDRIGEGLRVLEEFTRLSLNDAGLTQRLKNLRHQTVITDVEFQKQLLQARDAARDVGSRMDVPGETKGRDVAAIVVANARRVQESLRVMEELAKTPGVNLNPENYRQGRFALYTLEKELLGKLTRRDAAKKITGLYVIIDQDWLKGRQPEDIASQAIKAGAGVIQLRYKQAGTGEFLAAANAVKEVCVSQKVPFIINDRLDIALACNADGLHIGQEDLPFQVARRLLPINMLLGCSVRTVEETAQALAGGADYLGAGAVFATSTKDSAAIGLDNFKKIKESANIPVVAIGGINRDNIKSVMEAGADAAAVISAVLGVEDVAKAVGQLVNTIGGQKHG